MLQFGVKFIWISTASVKVYVLNQDVSIFMFYSFPTLHRKNKRNGEDLISPYDLKLFMSL